MVIQARTIALLGAIALALANLGRIPAGALAGRNAPVTLADLTVALVWAALALGILTGRVRIVVDGVIRWAFLFLCLASISTAMAVGRYGFSFDTVAFLVRWVLYFGWYPFVAWCLSADESRDAARFVDHALIGICVFGIFQAAFIPEFATRLPQVGDAPTWEYQGRRLVSTLLDPNFAGGIAVLALIPGLARVNEGLRQSVWRLLIPAAAIVLTASRSSVLALGVALGVIVLARGLRRPLVRTLLAGAVLVLPLIPAVIAFGESMNKFSIDASAAQRLVTWKRAVTLFIEHPLLGIGFNATRQAQLAKGWTFIGGADTAFDGGLLFVMVMTGVIGVIAYSLILGRGVLSARRIWRDPNTPAEDRAFSASAAASVLAIVFHSLFSNTLLLPYVMQVLWVRLGRVAHLTAERRARFGIPIAIPLVVVMAASCSPCTAFESCTTAHRLRLTGSIVDHRNGAPIGGAGITVTFRGTTTSEVKHTTTDAEGLWDVSGRADCCDAFSASVVVSPPDAQPYLVPAFPVRAFVNAGDANVVGEWTDRPFVNFLGTLVLDLQVPLVNAQVAFTPVSGVPIGVGPFNAVSDGSGIFPLSLVSDRLGNAIGTLTISHPDLAAPYRIEGFTIPLGNRLAIPVPTPVPVWTDP